MFRLKRYSTVHSIQIHAGRSRCRGYWRIRNCLTGVLIFKHAYREIKSEKNCNQFIWFQKTKNIHRETEHFSKITTSIYQNNRPHTDKDTYIISWHHLYCQVILITIRSCHTGTSQIQCPKVRNAKTETGLDTEATEKLHFWGKGAHGWKRMMLLHYKYILSANCFSYLRSFSQKSAISGYT